MPTPYDTENAELTQAIIAFAQSIRDKIDNPIAKSFLQYIDALAPTAGGVLTRVPQNGATPAYWSLTTPTQGSSLEIGYQPEKVSSNLLTNEIKRLLAKRIYGACFTGSVYNLRDEFHLDRALLRDVIGDNIDWSNPDIIALYSSGKISLPVTYNSRGLSFYNPAVVDNTNGKFSYSFGFSFDEFDGISGLVAEPARASLIDLATQALTNVNEGALLPFDTHPFTISSYNFVYKGITSTEGSISYASYPASNSSNYATGTYLNAVIIIRPPATGTMYYGLTGAVANGDAFIEVDSLGNLISSSPGVVGYKIHKTNYNRWLVLSLVLQAASAAVITTKIGFGLWGGNGSEVVAEELFYIIPSLRVSECHLHPELINGFGKHLSGYPVPTVELRSAGLSATSFARKNSGVCILSAQCPNYGTVITGLLTLELRHYDISTESMYRTGHIAIGVNRLTQKINIVLVKEIDQPTAQETTTIYESVNTIDVDKLTAFYYSFDPTSGLFKLGFAGQNQTGAVREVVDVPMPQFTEAQDVRFDEILFHPMTDTTVNSALQWRPFVGLLFCVHGWDQALPMSELEKLTYYLYLE